MKRSLTLLAALALPLATHAAPLDYNKTMHYKNQRGSILNITLYKKSPNGGIITGTFETAVASKNCQNVIGKPQPITGYYTGNAISLSISYPSCGAAIAIVGNFDKQNNLDTLWMDAHQAVDVEGKDWNTRMIGYDRYMPVR